MQILVPLEKNIVFLNKSGGGVVVPHGQAGLADVYTGFASSVYMHLVNALASKSIVCSAFQFEFTPFLRPDSSLEAPGPGF